MALTTSIDIDTGGTFTDVFLVRDGVPHTAKVLTTPHDLAVCFQQVIEKSAGELRPRGRRAAAPDADRALRDDRRHERDHPAHRTAARADRRAPAATRCTPMPRRRDAVFDLFLDREMVATVGADGDGDAAGSGRQGASRRLCARPRLRAPGRATARTSCASASRSTTPSTASTRSRCCSRGEITIDRDDARRTATALFNAYVHPDVADYLYRAEDYLRDNGYRRPLLVVHNDGGCARVAKTVAAQAPTTRARRPGLLGGRAIARPLRPRDARHARHGRHEPRHRDRAGGRGADARARARRGRRGRLPASGPGRRWVPEAARSPWLDGGRAPRRTAQRGRQARPGVLRLRRRRTPTLTDADVVLGILRPNAFLGGSMAIDVEAARRRSARDRRAVSGATSQDAAWRVRTRCTPTTGARLAAELRARGVDPAGATVLAFGGNGATHCAGIAAGGRDRRRDRRCRSRRCSARSGASTADVAPPL